MLKRSTVLHRPRVPVEHLASQSSNYSARHCIAISFLSGTHPISYLNCLSPCNGVCQLSVLKPSIIQLHNWHRSIVYIVINRATTEHTCTHAEEIRSILLNLKTSIVTVRQTQIHEAVDVSVLLGVDAYIDCALASKIS